MANNASRKFRFAPDIFLSLFSTTYSPQQSPGTWHAFQPPFKIISSVIYALREQPFKVGMSPVKILSRSIATGCPSAPKCICATCLRIRRTPLLSYFRCLVTGSVTDTTPRGCPLSGQTRLLRCGMLSPRLTSLKSARTLGSRLGPTSGTLTNASPV